MEQTKLTFKKADIHDIPEIAKLLKDDEVGGASRTEQGFRELVGSKMTDPNSYYQVALLDNKVVGMCFLTVKTESNGQKTLLIEHVRVAADSGHHGIGTAVLQNAIKTVKDNKIDKVELKFDATREGKAMTKFYTTSGFVATGTLGLASISSKTILARYIQLR
jgi:N-acetylglutamate synthase-like GNAT family acetyltransferase